MRKLRILATAIVGLWCVLAVNAFEINYDFMAYHNNREIYYIKTSNSTVEVTFRGYNSDDEYVSGYYGDVVIPSTVTYNGTTYTVTEIGSAFSSNESVTSITIPETVIKINGFGGCSNLVSVNIPSGVTRLPDRAFSGCSSLASITIPENVQTMGEYVFNECNSLKSVILPEGVERIEKQAFYGCSSLKSFIVPESVNFIGQSAFSGCSNLSSFTVKSTSSPSLGAGAFSGIPKSCVLNYPEGSYESYAGWSEYFTVAIPDICVNGIYYEVTSESTVAVTFQGDGYSSYADEYTGDVVIPETVIYGDKTYTVTAIGLSAFSACRNVTSITLPSTVKEIGSSGIRDCDKLTSVVLPEGLEIIGWSAFLNSPNLENVTLPNGLVRLDAFAFENCPKLTEINIPASVDSIGTNAFKKCSGLQSITFEGFVSSIGHKVFENCSSLTKVKVNSIADWCKMGFWYSSSNPLSMANLYIGDECITELEVPAEVEKINKYAFYDYDDLVSVDFGTGVKFICERAFAGCNGLKELAIPSNVTLIENNAFSGCQEIQQITFEDSENTLTLGCIPNDNPNYEPYGLFSTCRLSKPLYIGRNIAYSYDANVGPFELVNGYYEQMGTVTFGELVTEIPPYLLNKYTYITDIYFKFKSNPKIGENAFSSNQEIHLALNDAENTDFDVTNANTFASAEYYRELGEGKYGTIILPFAPQSDKYVFFKLTSTDGDMLTFDEETEPKANTPYLYCLRENAQNEVIKTNTQVTIAADINNAEVYDWKMVGSFVNEVLDTENNDTYYYGYTAADNKLHRATKKLTVKPYRAYFTANGSQPTQLAVRTRSGETSIINVSEVEDLAPEVYYDLSGRRVENPAKGIYIVNGEKVILK